MRERHAAASGIAVDPALNPTTPSRIGQHNPFSLVQTYTIFDAHLLNVAVPTAAVVHGPPSRHPSSRGFYLSGRSMPVTLPHWHGKNFPCLGQRDFNPVQLKRQREIGAATQRQQHATHRIGFPCQANETIAARTRRAVKPVRAVRSETLVHRMIDLSAARDPTGSSRKSWNLAAKPVSDPSVQSFADSLTFSCLRASHEIEKLISGIGSPDYSSKFPLIAPNLRNRLQILVCNQESHSLVLDRTHDFISWFRRPAGPDEGQSHDAGVFFLPRDCYIEYWIS